MRFRLFLLLILLALIFLFITPILSWYIMKPMQLNIAIINKTVPNKNYFEHLGLSWLLNNKKIVDNKGNLYKLDQDYYGYNPNGEKSVSKLILEDDFNLIYIVDTYGVYNGNFNNRIVGDENNLISGGLNSEEWDEINKAKKSETTMIIEFNTLGLPTKPSIRKDIEDSLSIKWSGWSAKYFLDLGKVPQWLINIYEYQERKSWDFGGYGIIFVNQFDKIVILKESDFKNKVRFVLTEEGEQHFQLAKNSTYNNWFDIIIPNEELVIEANFELNINDIGKEKLENKGIPLHYPAISYQPKINSYYFAGDFAEEKNDYWSKWILPRKIKNIIAYFQREDFFWKSYDPIMEQIFKDAFYKK